MSENCATNALEAEGSEGFWIVFKQNSVKTLKIEKLHLKCDHFLGSYYQTIIPGVVSLVLERVNLT